jgi:hypothetical protein
VKVAACHRQAGMPKGDLHEIQSGPTLKRMAGVAIAKPVRTDVRLDFGFCGGVPQEP